MYPCDGTSDLPNKIHTTRVEKLKSRLALIDRSMKSMHCRHGGLEGQTVCSLGQNSRSAGPYFFNVWPV